MWQLINFDNKQAVWVTDKQGWVIDGYCLPPEAFWIYYGPSIMFSVNLMGKELLDDYGYWWRMTYDIRTNEYMLTNLDNFQTTSADNQQDFRFNLRGIRNPEIKGEIFIGCDGEYRVIEVKGLNHTYYLTDGKILMFGRHTKDAVIDAAITSIPGFQEKIIYES